jgi:hypothetical protein
MAIDRADWHYGADDFPSELHPENGGTHIGMFLAWAILNKLASRELTEDWPDEIAAVKSRQMTGCAFLFKACDEKFWESDLSDEGNAFVAWYYSRPDGSMPYVDDYANALAEDLPTVYHVADTWENYDKVAPIVSAAHAEWKASQGRV